MVSLPGGEKMEDTYNGLDKLPACDGQTNRHLATAYTVGCRIETCGLANDDDDDNDTHVLVLSHTKKALQ